MNLPEYLRSQIAEALEGESNDAEHDALVAVADEFGVRYTPEPDDLSDDRYHEEADRATSFRECFPERITCEDVRVGDTIGRTRDGERITITEIHEGPKSRRLIYGPRTRYSRKSYGVNIRPGRTAKLWRFVPESYQDQVQR